MFFQNINYWVVLVSAIAGLGVGFIWFSEWVFGKAWIAARTAREEFVRAKMGRPMAPVWAIMLVTRFVVALVIAALLNSLIVTSLGGLFVLALCVWAGFSVPIKVSDYFFGNDSFKTFLISIGYEFASIFIMTLIVGFFG